MGLGQAGAAYMQWYQPLGRTEIYRTLVNSHLTWLVELGWLGRCGYALAWAAIFALCGCAGHVSFSGLVTMVPALWVTMFVGMIFSSVGESLPLWVPPGCGLGVMLVLRFRRRAWPPRRVWLVGGACALWVLLIFAVVGWLTPRNVSIRGRKTLVQLTTRVTTNKVSTVICLIPNIDVLGRHYGHAIRAEVARGQSFLVAPSLEQISQHMPAGNVVLALVGVVPSHWFAGFRRITLFNPRGLPPPQKTATPLRVVWGELREQGDKAAWRDWALSRPHGQLIEAPAAAEFLPDWSQWLTW